jgi:formylglycine-generating enzyme required for sulfatase activity
MKSAADIPSGFPVRGGVRTPGRACATVLIAVCVLLGSARGLPAQAGKPAMDARAAAEARLAEARAEKDAAADALERMVHELRDDYAALTTGDAASTYRHAIVLAIQDSLETARTRIASDGAGGRAVLRGRRRQILAEAFAEPVEQASPVDPRMSAWVARGVAQALSARDPLGPVDADQLLAVVDGLLPGGLTWYEFWNDRFHQDLPEAQRWSAALVAYEAAGVALDRLVQPERYGAKGELAPPGMVIVPGGNYELGPNTGWQRSSRRAQLKVFAIDRHEVTQGEYAVYVNALQESLRPAALPRGWTLGPQGLAEYDVGRRDHPVVYVSWAQAAGYAAWSGKRLPTEDEWEAAAAGTLGRAYPWGNEFRANHANGDEAADDTLPVEAFPDGRSPVGALDMVGNAWEWTATLEDGSNIKELPEGLVNAIIRGGGYESRREELTTRYRRGALAHDTFAPPRYKVPIGFRCVQDL